MISRIPQRVGKIPTRHPLNFPSTPSPVLQAALSLACLRLAVLAPVSSSKALDLILLWRHLNKLSPFFGTPSLDPARLVTTPSNLPFTWLTPYSSALRVDTTSLGRPLWPAVLMRVPAVSCHSTLLHEPYIQQLNYISLIKSLFPRRL